ncbi:hypothetical protein SDC9_87485 [bioreactor metagenome]|uniref:IclR-ED domain-containing protein n=1 Tax=bioreactor metagenome TaxID=1076179 RepID=A0A644ZJD0_9ZZZZ
MRKRFDKVTWDKAPTFDQWKSEVEQCKALGWSVDRDNFMAGVTVVAVPVMSQSGRMTHTLAAVGLSSHLELSAVNALAAKMLQEARQLSGALP